MLITDMLRARSLLYYQREAARLLQEILGSLDIVPAPDGTVRFAFQGDVALVDRLAMWGSAIEDVEFDDGDAEPDHDLEDDARDLPRVTATDEELDDIRRVSRSALAALNRERGVPLSLGGVAA